MPWWAWTLVGWFAACALLLLVRLWATRNRTDHLHYRGRPQGQRGPYSARDAERWCQASLEASRARRKTTNNGRGNGKT